MAFRLWNIFIKFDFNFPFITKCHIRFIILCAYQIVVSTTKCKTIKFRSECLTVHRTRKIEFNRTICYGMFVFNYGMYLNRQTLDVYLYNSDDNEKGNII